MMIRSRDFSLIIVLTAILFIAGCKNPSGSTPVSEHSGILRFYVGAYDQNLEHSIYLCELDLNSSRFAVLDSFTGARGPSYLALSPERDVLYSIDQTISDPETDHMTVTAFRVDEKGRLKVLNRQSSLGSGPCHISCSQQGTYLFVSNYTSGNNAVFPLAKDGTIQQASCTVQSEGTGPVESRQEGPHTHFVSLDLPENFLLSPDLGSDKVLVYSFDHATGVLTPNPDQPFLKLDPGSGPRHLVFHPAGDLVFVVNELNASVSACRYEEETGKLTLIHTIGTERGSNRDGKYSAAIRIHPNGKYLYASTRGEKSTLTVFEIEDYGNIFRSQVVEDVPGWPRDLNIDPSGSILLAVGRRSNEIEMFRIDPETGKLSATGVKMELPSPGCILFID